MKKTLTVLAVVLGCTAFAEGDVAKVFVDKGSTYLRSEKKLKVGDELVMVTDAAGATEAGHALVMEVNGALVRVTLDDEAAKANAKFARLSAPVAAKSAAPAAKPAPVVAAAAPAAAAPAAPTASAPGRCGTTGASCADRADAQRPPRGERVSRRGLQRQPHPVDGLRISIFRWWVSRHRHGGGDE